MNMGSYSKKKKKEEKTMGRKNSIYSPEKKKETISLTYLLVILEFNSFSNEIA